MLLINKYAEIIENNFYLDGETIRRKVDGYLGRYKKGDEVVGFQNNSGYLHIQIPKVRSVIKTSHIKLFLLGVRIPEGSQVDHIDQNKLNEHSSNLRVVSQRVNCCNRTRRSDNTSGHTGIRWSDYHQHYVIRTTVNGIRKSTSRKTLEEAIEARKHQLMQDVAYTRRHGK